MKESIQELSQKKFGRLKVIEEANYYIAPSGKKRRQMKCICDCGNYKVVLLTHLRSGKVQSCGCYHKESKITHGKSDTLIYSIWHNLKDRCHRETAHNYKYYGGRGIMVCDRWKESFENFYNDMFPTYKKGLTIDRKDNDGNYEPSNCRWITTKENNRNSRKAKLTIEEVLDIRNANLLNLFTTNEIAKGYNVSGSTILKIINNQLWI